MQPAPRTAAPNRDDELPTTLGEALSALTRNPLRWVVRYWNWKNAVLSFAARGTIFFSVNLAAGWDSAVSALLTELCYRAPMVGSLASLSQTFRRVRPAWKAGLAMMLALPALGHAIELAVHSLRGTAKLYESVAASVGFSMFTCLVGYFLHRRGVLIVGHGARPFGTEIFQLPGELFDLLLRKPFAALREAGRGGPRPPP